MKKAIVIILFLALTGGACRYFQHDTHVRRVSANPGDVVEVRDGTVLVNGVAEN